MSDYKNPLSDYGKRIKVRLLELNKKQEWLISEIRKRYPEVYVDSSNIHKILVGEIRGGKVVTAINEILEFEDLKEETDR